MFKQLLRKLANAISPLDPIAAAEQRDDIKAAARYWRDRVATARIGGAYDASWETTVRECLTDTELDRFEKEMANQLARALHYTRDDNNLFQERGVDISLYVSCAASAAAVRSKLAYTGFFARMRILPDKEVAHELAPYRSGNWVTVWSAPHDPKPE